MQRFTQRANKAVWFFLAGSLRDARRHLKWKLKQNINLSSKFENSNFRSRYRIPFLSVLPLPAPPSKISSALAP